MNDYSEEYLEEENTQKGKFMTFKLLDEYYGIGINYVNEIIGMQKLTEIPESESYFKGFINLRGKIIPTIDVRMRFKKEPLEYNDRTCIIIINIGRTEVGLIVDEIAEVVNIAEEDIVPPPSISSSYANRYVYGIGQTEGEVKLLLDCEKLINEDELIELNKMSTEV